ncbi:MAG: hypothetical protein ACREM1_02475 [Longimicrobiales bacterium]
MADNIQKVDYWYVTVDNEPGAGARVLETLRDRGVNLRACHGFPSEGRAQLDLVPEDGEKLRTAAEEAGLSLSERKRALIAEGEDRVGAVAEMLGRLASAGINVVAIDALAAGAGRYGALLWVAPEDYEQAATVLGAA